MRQKIVVRLKDGSLKKCSTFSHFSSAYTKLKVLTTEGGVETVDLKDVKAIFFVRDFAGDASYEPRREFQDGSPKAGQAVTVRFSDGEVIRGRVINLAERSAGFFLFPADPNENNQRVFVVRTPGVQVEVEA